MPTSDSSENRDDEIRRLRRAVDELSVLNELARAVSVSRDPEEIIRTIVTRSIRAVGAEQATITLVDEGEMEPTGTLVREMTRDEDPHYHLNRNLLGCMSHEQRALMVNDPAGDHMLRGISLAPGIRNLICVPLQVGATLIGVLSAYNKVGGDFQPEDQRLLAIMASQSAQVLDRARLEEREKSAQALREDMRLAEAIQEALLPGGEPGIPGYDVAGASVAAGRVGGDYFDFIPLEKNLWAIALGDVSGKGAPASLLMANLQATLRSQALQEHSCRRAVTNGNHLLFLSTTADKFATLFYATLDVESHVLTYCNAGHEHPFLLTADGGIRRLATGGLPVGVLPDFLYEDDTVNLSPGDRVVIFSDGVTDMENDRGEPFGEDRLLDFLTRHTGLPSMELVRKLVATVQGHAGKASPLDDVTVMVLQRR